MNDFLQQLRSGGKRFDRGRRPYDGGQYRNNDRMNNRDRKNPAHRKNFDANQLHAIKKTLENIVEGQKKLTGLAERQAASSERIAGALEEMVRHLIPTVIKDPVVPTLETASDAAEEASAAPAAGELPEAQTAKPSDASGSGRETVQQIIVDMRNNGASFDQIAEHLKAEKIPTLSGRGHWRAQVVSRLYNQRSS